MSPDRMDDAPTPALSDLAFHILLALQSGQSHGYEIGQRVQELSEGRLDPTTGALYQALRRLIDEGRLESADPPTGVDPRRKYVALTRSGRTAMLDEARRLERLLDALDAEGGLDTPTPQRA